MARTKLLLAFTIVVVSCTLISAHTWLQKQETPALAVTYPHNMTLILDAGHGGEDGGAVSVTGIPESKINLSIVLRTEDLLGLYGICPILTRHDNRSLHDSTAVTLREKKRSDLENRLEAVERVEGGVLLSIHQNTYPDNQYHGAQVFFAPTSMSYELAEHLQSTIVQILQPDNTRACKPVPDTVYLMNHVTCPAVLLECGFLTNPGEEALLKDPSYQTKLAAVIASAWLTAPING